MKAFNRNDNIGFLLNSTTSALNTLMQRTLTKENIDVPFEQLKLLMYISFNPGVNQQEICIQLGKAKPGISRLVDGLVKKELVERKENPNDRRNTQLFPTPNGLAMRERFYPIGLGNLNGLESLLGREESEELKKHLVALKEIILNKLKEDK